MRFHSILLLIVTILVVLSPNFVLFSDTESKRGSNGRQAKELTRTPNHSESDEAVDGCIGCHSQIEGHRHVSEWKMSQHARRGVGCSDCHGDPHGNPADRGRPVDCTQCHAKHGELCSNGGHANAMDSIQHALAGHETESVRMLTCVRCHKIGEKLTSFKSSGVRCASCHFDHTFSVSVARSSETCRTCHEGINSPQWDVYTASRHGAIINGHRVAKCVDCHDPHEDSCGVSVGKGGVGAILSLVEFPMHVERISPTDAASQRKRMIAKCIRCHSHQKVAEELANADKIKQEADYSIKHILDKVCEVLNPETIQKWTIEVSGPDPGTKIDSEKFNPNGTRLEQLLFKATKHYYPLMWKAAYHQAPSKVLEARRELDRLTKEIELELQNIRRQSKLN